MTHSVTHSLSPRHVERNYVPLSGVTQSNVDLRYYVSRITSDCYLNIVVERAINLCVCFMEMFPVLNLHFLVCLFL